MHVHLRPALVRWFSTSIPLCDHPCCVGPHWWGFVERFNDRAIIKPCRLCNRWRKGTFHSGWWKHRLFTRATTTQESALKVSHAVSLELAKTRKPLSDGEIVVSWIWSSRETNSEVEPLTQKYRAEIEKLQEQSNDRFQEFHVTQPRIALFTDPLSGAVSERTPIRTAARTLRFETERGISFWRLLPEARFSLLRDFALSMASMFGSTYICERGFSIMKHIKSKGRNRLTDDTLFHLMRIGCTKIDIDFQSIVRQQAKPQVSP